MSDIAFILGAGASRQCGAPLMHDFLDCASQLHSSGEVEEFKEDFERVFRAIAALQTVHSKAQLDINNIESVFTAFEVAKLLKQLPQHEPEEIEQVIASLKKLIVVTLERTVSYRSRGGRRVQLPVPYGEFVKLVNGLQQSAKPKSRVSIITFNYDLALDISLSQANFDLYYGLNGRKSVNQVGLYKLHGSLNWGLEKATDNPEIIALSPRDFFDKYSFNYHHEDDNIVYLPFGSSIQEYMKVIKDVDVEEEAVIVPPSWNKVDYHQILEGVWSRASKELQEAQHIIVCGYSMPDTDPFFKLLYGLGTAGTVPLKSFVVYNPDKTGQTEKRFRDLMGPGALARFEYIPKTFDQALHNLRGRFTFDNLDWFNVQY